MTRKQILFGNMKEEEQKIKDIDNLITIFNKYFPNQNNFDEEQLLAISSSHKNTLISARA